MKTLFSDAILGPEKRVFVLSCYEEDESMIRKKSIMAAALAAVLACQTFPAFGGAAPDGKTLAQDTEVV